MRTHPRRRSGFSLVEMLTVIRLGLPLSLRRSLACTNIIENMMGTIRRVCRNVTRWRDGQMVLRWTAAGMTNAQRSFRRVKGYKQMPQLVAALYRHAHPDTTAPGETVGAAA